MSTTITITHTPHPSTPIQIAKNLRTPADVLYVLARVQHHLERPDGIPQGVLTLDHDRIIACMLALGRMHTPMTIPLQRIANTIGEELGELMDARSF